MAAKSLKSPPANPVRCLVLAGAVSGAVLFGQPMAAMAIVPWTNQTDVAAIVQTLDGELYTAPLDEISKTFTFDFVDAALHEYNNLGYRRTDGLLYAVHLTGVSGRADNVAGANAGIIQIDSTGTVFPVGMPTDPDWTDTRRFAAGDVSFDGKTMYINVDGSGTLYMLDLTDPLGPTAVTTKSITGATGIVFDWAYNPADGLLYGGDQQQGQLAVLDPATGVRTDYAVAGLPTGTAYGGAWFDTKYAIPTLALFRNSGTIYEIELADLGALTILYTHAGPSSTFNDATFIRASQTQLIPEPTSLFLIVFGVAVGVVFRRLSLAN